MKKAARLYRAALPPRRQHDPQRPPLALHRHDPRHREGVFAGVWGGVLY